jgi:hypothetical protein
VRWRLKRKSGQVKEKRGSATFLEELALSGITAGAFDGRRVEDSSL